jgi:hypothetical protein
MKQESGVTELMNHEGTKDTKEEGRRKKEEQGKNVVFC